MIYLQYSIAKYAIWVRLGHFMDIRSLELFQHLASSLHFAKTAE